MKAQKDCRHETIGFQSGDYYIFCRDCPARWVMQSQDTSGPDKVSTVHHGIGVGSQLSGEDRYAQQPDRREGGG